MSRYRLAPTAEQEAILRQHCAQARYVWNLALEQQPWWRPGRRAAPGYCAQAAQLTQARAEYRWLRDGSQMVPRKTGQAWIPKAGWVRFRRSRPVPEASSYRVTRDRAGRWHIAFAAIPEPIPGPVTGEIVGIDRGVIVSAALSTGELLHCPAPHPAEQARQRRRQRRLARATKGSNRSAQFKAAIARLRAREGDRRKDWAEKTSTDLARRFDVIRIEDLRITGMTRSARGTLAQPGRGVRQKAGLNRSILSSGWGLLARRLEDKAPGRAEKIHPAYTSQRCSACGHVAADSRKSQAVFCCVACGYVCHADVNAAKNTAAGHAVAARGRLPVGGG
jgi:putative transposase